MSCPETPLEEKSKATALSVSRRPQSPCSGYLSPCCPALAPTSDGITPIAFSHRELPPCLCLCVWDGLVHPLTPNWQDSPQTSDRSVPVPASCRAFAEMTGKEIVHSGLHTWDRRLGLLRGTAWRGPVPRTVSPRTQGGDMEGPQGTLLTPWSPKPDSAQKEHRPSFLFFSAVQIHTLL